jgi:hypothetical protein
MTYMYQRRFAWGALLLTTLLATTSGCSDTPAEDEPAPPPAPCELPNRRLDDDSCVGPGVQPDGCEAGQVGIEGGECIAAGIPSDACAEGFVATDDGGCEPTLPPDVCAPGTMAIPGEASCREIMPCGSGQWGDIAIESGAVFVDASFGGASNGSMVAPFVDLSSAIAAAADNGQIVVAAGTYSDNIVVARALRIWGKCPAEVVLAPANQGVPAITASRAGVEIHGIAIRDVQTGVRVQAADGVLLDRLYIHDTTSYGIDAINIAPPVSVTVADSLVERASINGILAEGASLTLERSVVRDTQPQASSQQGGRGVQVFTPTGDAPAAPSFINNSLIDRNHEVSMYLDGVDMTIDASVIRDSLPQVSDNSSGRALSIEQAGDAPTVVRVTRSYIARQHDNAIFVAGGDLQLDATVVSDTFPRMGNSPGSGRAIALQRHPNSGSAARAQITRSLIRNSEETGVYLSGAEAIIDATIIRNIAAVNEQVESRSISAQPSPSSGERSMLSVLRSVIEDGAGIGIFASASHAAVDGVLVQRVAPRITDGWFGRGIIIQVSASTGDRGSGEITHSVIRNAHEVGLVIADADVTVVDTKIEQTQARPIDQLLGDGVVLFHIDTGTNATFSRVLVEQSARAGIVSFGAQATIADSLFHCNALDLVAEQYEGAAGVLNDGGRNLCGCEDQLEACRVSAAGLTPPPPP